MSSFAPRMDILPRPQLDLWPSLAPLSQLGFVLYGGTAVALRLGHRQSVDFDFFCDLPLERTALRTALSFLGSSTVLQDEPNSLTVLSSGGVKVSFFGRLGFGRYGEPSETEDGVLQVASLEDLLALKIKVILQRCEAKDYRDIAAMLRAKLSLELGLAIAAEMFKPELSVAIALKALTYFEGGDLGELSAEDRQTLVRSARYVSKLPYVALCSRQLSSPSAF